MALKVLNLARLERKINRLPKEVQTEIRKELEKQADIIVGMMKRLVPVDTGELRDSIGWAWGKIPKGAMSLGSMTKAQLGAKLTITIYAGNEKTLVAGEGNRFQHQLARLQEFGTQDMKAQPFFFPSYRASKKKAKSALTRAGRKAIRKMQS